MISFNQLASGGTSSSSAQTIKPIASITDSQMSYVLSSAVASTQIANVIIPSNKSLIRVSGYLSWRDTSTSSTPAFDPVLQITVNQLTSASSTYSIKSAIGPAITDTQAAIFGSGSVTNINKASPVFQEFQLPAGYLPGGYFTVSLVRPSTYTGSISVVLAHLTVTIV